LNDAGDRTKTHAETKESGRRWWLRLVDYVKHERHERRARKKSEKPEQRAVRWTMWATVAMAIFTIALATVSYFQLREMHQSGVDSSGQMNQLIEKYRQQVAQVSRQASETHELAVQAKNQAERTKTIAQQAVIQANQTAQLAELTRKTLETSQKAYVTIGRPDGVVAEILWPKEDTGNAGLLVYFQNNGRLPARFNWGADSTIVAIVPTDPAITAYGGWHGGQTELPTNHLFQPMYRARHGKNQIAWSGTIDIAGGSSYQGVLWEVPKERMMELINFENSLLLQPAGKFEYCDGFGKRVCRRFNLRYAKEPYNRFFLAMEDECSVMDMQILHPTPDYQYLPVCSTSERPEMQVMIPSLPRPQ
jgi:hypothetical protein